MFCAPWARFCSLTPKYKSFTDFITDILGLRAGFFVGWSYWFFWVVTGIADVIAITGYIKYWWPEIPAFIPALTVIVALLLLNLPSVKNFGEIEFWFAMVKIVSILALIAVGAVMVVAGFTSPDGTGRLYHAPVGSSGTIGQRGVYSRSDGVLRFVPDCVVRVRGR